LTRGMAGQVRVISNASEAENATRVPSPMDSVGRIVGLESV